MMKAGWCTARFIPWRTFSSDILQFYSQSMTVFFVNLPLGFIVNHPKYLELFLSRGICPELGMDASSMDSYSLKEHEELGLAFKSKGIKVSMHMPFTDLSPGSMDCYIREASARRLMQGAMLARRYSPGHVIIHSGYRPETCANCYWQWLENSASTWKTVLGAVPDIPVYLENVYEPEPGPLRDLLNKMDGRAKFCFDLGHWFSFGRGVKKKNLNTWLESMAPHLGHLHLHDNDGSQDAHLGMGAGDIPFDRFFAGLKTLGLSPTFTLEPHTPLDLEQSMIFMAAHREWFSLLGLKEDDFDRLQLIADCSRDLAG